MKLSKKLLTGVLFVLAAFVLIACGPEETPPVADSDPVFSGVGPANVWVNTSFDPMAGVTAHDAEDGDLTADIVITVNTVNVDFVGTYAVGYSVTDSDGNTTTANRAVMVNQNEEHVPLAQYLNGVELNKLTADQKGILFAALERYLLENVYAGVPLYTNAARVIFSDRVQLFTNEFNGVLGFGTGFSTLTEDDSTVQMLDGVMGNAGEYTWRSAFTTNPSTFNPWTADDSNSDDFITMFTGGLYDFYFDDTKTGYEINPSLAASDPVPTDPTELNGRTYAKIWRISLKPGLEWTFHPDTNTSGFAAGFETLDANDYLWTWKKALTESWFRAISGGGDFLSMGIKGAEAYVANPNEANWANVGIRKIDDLTIELEYVSDQSTFDVKYAFAGNSKPALQPELYEALGQANYGLGPTSVASSGVYYFDEYTPSQLLLFKKNDNHPDSNMYHYTGQQFRYVPDTNTAWAEFEAGRLESGSVPAAEVNNYKDDPRVKVSPQATTWRLVMNAFGTTAKRDQYIFDHPELGLSETFVPEPILQYQEFRQALFYGFNRIAATNAVPVYTPAWTMYASTYFLDAEGGISVRGTAEGQAVSDDFGGSSAGYVPDAAVALFKQAVAKGIADGHYQAGTAQNPTTIELTLTWASSGSVNAQAMVANLVSQYEALLVDDVNHVNIDIVVNDVAFPDNYYNYMMLANTDLGIGGISGSLLDAPDFMDVFRDDNYGGFTLDWGIDTSSANIVVTYTNLDGNEVTERWSFNALVNALNRKTYVKNGQIQTKFESAEELIQAQFDVNGVELGDVTAANDKAALAHYFIGASLAVTKTARLLDDIELYLVTDAADKEYLYVIGVVDGDYTLYGSYALSSLASDGLGTVLGEFAFEQSFAAEATERGVDALFAKIASTAWGDFSNYLLISEKDGVYTVVEEAPLNSKLADFIAEGADGTVIAETVLETTLEDLAEDLEVDAVHAVSATLSSGSAYVFVISELDGDYEVVQQVELSTDPFDAIQNHNSDYSLDESTFTGVPLTFEEMMAIQWMIDTYGADGWTSLDDAFAEAGVPAGVDAEVYYTSWNGEAWDDAYVVLVIDGFYVGWYWL